MSAPVRVENKLAPLDPPAVSVGRHPPQPSPQHRPAPLTGERKARVPDHQRSTRIRPAPTHVTKTIELAGAEPKSRFLLPHCTYVRSAHTLGVFPQDGVSVNSLAKALPD